MVNCCGDGPVTAELRTVVEASNEHCVAPHKMPGSEVGVHPITELLQDAKAECSGLESSGEFTHFLFPFRVCHRRRACLGAVAPARLRMSYLIKYAG